MDTGLFDDGIERLSDRLVACGGSELLMWLRELFVERSGIRRMLSSLSSLSCMRSASQSAVQPSARLSVPSSSLLLSLLLLSSLALFPALSPLSFLSAVSSECGSAAWAGSLVLFSGHSEGQADLYELQLPDLTPRPLTRTAANEKYVAVAPDRETLAIVSDHNGADSLYLANRSNMRKAWRDLSVGVGAHAYPRFSPDGKVLLVQYAPDPEDLFSNTRLVKIDLSQSVATHTVLLEASAIVPRATADDPVAVIAHPEWLDNTRIVFALILYADPEVGRVSKSGIYTLDLGNVGSSPPLRPVRLAGGEAYSDAEGRLLGYQAGFPRVQMGADGAPAISFAALESGFKRTPMLMTADGANRRVLPLVDEEFFGPILWVGTGFLYGFQDDDGRLGLALKEPAAGSVAAGEGAGKKTGKGLGKGAAGAGIASGTRRVVPFPGRIEQPVLVP